LKLSAKIRKTGGVDLGNAGVGLPYSEAYLGETKFLVVVQSDNQALLFWQAIDRRRDALPKMG
jgi:hypothetical protein